METVVVYLLQYFDIVYMAAAVPVDTDGPN